MINKIQKNIIYNIRTAFTTKKIPLLIIVIMVLLHDYFKVIVDFSASNNLKISIWTFPLIFNQKYIRCIINLGIVILFCDLPVAKQNYYFLIPRSGKKNWIIGQFGYIIAMSLLYYTVIFIVSIAVNIKNIEITKYWGKVIEMSVNGYLNPGYKVYISQSIVKLFSPQQATFFTFFLNFLMACFIGNVIMFFNMRFDMSPVGVVIASILVLLDLISLYYPKLVWISPVTWSNLEFVKIYQNTNEPSIQYVVIWYIVLVFLLFICSLKYHNKKTLENI